MADDDHDGHAGQTPDDRPREVYTHGHHESVLRSHTWRTAANSAGYLLPHLSPGTTVLDVGCGPGTITLDLARRVAPGEVLGIDPVEHVLAAPRATAAEQGLTSVRFAVGDAYALGLPDDTVDVVHAHQVLQHLGDPVAALREMRRVARPGGLVAARDADYGAMTWTPPEPRLDAWLALYSAVARGNHGDPDAGRHLGAWAAAAGFADVTMSSSRWTFRSADERTWWAGLWADRTTTSAFAAQALDRGLATADDLAGIADGWRAWARQPDGVFVVPHGELLARA